MLTKRQRRENLIKNHFDEKRAIETFLWIARQRNRRRPFGFLDFLDDDTVDEIAYELVTDNRATQRANQRNQVLYAARHHKEAAE